ncbi:helix-turn-helix transcriptional regulator [Saccharibacillus sacchari]|uniref:helix-turn-helix transcriptional regulator n=1 Tax=Saccharibacillus sacchari TaxID=456493 RepID=UPI0004B3F007|nr:WYL domain-containing protein [Saccharibacillus sacchari]
MELDYKSNKGFRLLNIYELLHKGEMVEKKSLAERYGVTQKTIQRDIDELREYLADTRFSKKEQFIVYDRTRFGYYLSQVEREWITNEEVLAICKILLESRAFCKEELDSLVRKLLAQVTSKDREFVGSMIRNEQFYYVPLKHGKRLLGTIWELSQLLTKNEVLQISYIRQDLVEREHKIKPIAIMFSEYYFYLVTFMADDRYDFPTIFRIDRITSFKSLKTKFNIPYRDRFNDGEFRKRVQFMYAGELRRVKFKFIGASIEAVLDRLPTAEILSQDEEGYIVSAEVYGTGIEIWLRGQGANVKKLNS